VAFEILLAASQGCLIGLNFMKAPANFRRFLSGHAAMLVEFHWVVRHDRLPFLSLGKPCVCKRVDEEDTPPSHGTLDYRWRCLFGVSGRAQGTAVPAGGPVGKEREE
jgi:hypothetical protein